MIKKHSTYIDFLSDMRFIRWQLMTDEELNLYWDVYINNHPETIEEMQKAISFLKKEGLNQSGLNKTDKEILLNRIKVSLRKKRIKRLKVTLYSAAAVAILLLSMILFNIKDESVVNADKDLIVGEILNSEDIQLITSTESIAFQNDIDVKLNAEGDAEVTQKNNETRNIKIKKDEYSTLVVPYGKRSTLTLADGSKVWLNSGSVLEFTTQFSGNKREIKLQSGEMYIEVSHDKKRPFYVHANDFNVRVYGTKFNITNYAESPKQLVLVEGSVGLQTKDSKETILKPSDLAVFNDKGMFDLKKVDVDQFISWKDGYLTLNKTPMNEVLRQVSRYYNLDFNLDDNVELHNRSCTGKIYLSENIDNVMETVGLLSSTEYEKIENNIYITNKSD